MGFDQSIVSQIRTVNSSFVGSFPSCRGVSQTKVQAFKIVLSIVSIVHMRSLCFVFRMIGYFVFMTV